MSNIEEVKKLRKLSGAGFKDCLSALNEAEGNLDKALEILRVKGISKASKKMARTANEGIVVICGDKNKSSILEINCETDFVAKNQDFIKFAKEVGELNNKVDSSKEKLNSSLMTNNKSVEDNLVALISKIGEKISLGRNKTIKTKSGKIYTYHHSIVQDNLSKLGVMICLEASKFDEKIDLIGKQISMHIAAMDPLAISSDLIDGDIIKKEKELINEELKNSGKPDNIIEKISVGKLSKFKEDSSLLSQDWVMDPKRKLSEILKETDNTLKILDFKRLKIGDGV